jgi:hypothetical protein
MAILTMTISTIRTLPELKEIDINDTSRTPEEHKKIDQLNETFDTIQLVCVIWFTIDILIRFICSPNFLTFIKQPINIFEAIITAFSFSYYFLKQNQGSVRSLFFIFRVFRIVYFLRLFRYSKSVQILIYTFRNSVKLFLVLLIYILVLTISFSSIVYLAEESDPKNPYRTIYTIPDAMWWAIVSITTVGYGRFF